MGKNTPPSVPASDLTWAITSDKRIALALGFIGVLYVAPTTLSRAVQLALGRPLRSAVIGFYYGVPDDDMIDRFNLDKSEVQRQVGLYDHPANGPHTEDRYLKVKREF